MNSIKKNGALLFLLLPCFLLAQTQTVTDTSLAKNFKKFGITVNLNSVGVIASNGLGNVNFENNQLIDGGDMKNRSYNLGLNLSYMMTQDWGLRLKMTTTQWNYSAYRNLLDEQPNNPPYARTDDVRITSSDYSFAPGIFYQWRIKKLALIAGASVEFIIHNEEKYSDYVTQDDPNPANAYQVHNTITVPSGYSVGISAFMGANYYFKNRFSVGLELSTSFLYTNIGDRTYINTTVISGTIIQPSSFWYEESINSFQYGQLKGSLNISYYF
jgi:hypothetical protein